MTNPMMRHLCLLMQKCFMEAEQALIEIVKEKFHALNEEMLTHLFWCELKVAVTKRNNEKEAWSHTLVLDLAEFFRMSLDGYVDLQQDVGGLFCEVQLHNHYREGMTGGDFGLFTSLPEIASHWSRTDECRIPIRDRALLVQAKLRQADGKYGGLSCKQKEHLLAGEKFSAFVLYGYNDDDKNELAPFQWQPCKGAKLEDMEGWLKNAKPPDPLKISEMIRRIYNKELGTDDTATIRDRIKGTGDVRPRFEITLTWPKRPNEPDGILIRLSDYITEPATIQVSASQS